MTGKDGKARNSDQASLSEAFGTANPSYWSTLSVDQAKAQQAAELHRRADEAIDELNKNFRDTHDQRFMDQVPIEKATRNAQAEELAQGARSDFLMPPRVAHQANENLAADHQRQIQSIRKGAHDAARDLANESSNPNQTKEEVTKAMSEQERASHFKAEIHRVLDEAQQARTQARRTFAQERKSLIDHARDQGSENPERDVSVAHAKTLQKIDKAEHQSVHKVFENYGWERGLKKVEFSDEAEKIDNQKLRKMVEEEVWQGHAEESQREDQAPDHDSPEHDEDHDRGH